ncbi:MAG TPA: ABC transporter permease [Chloroflexota bacterium]|jgi:ABC-type nitrate/sulfonate/bicarbonate transport system permease component|nr:ABC transporter permease [Chloroflexota bacterium]
MRQIQAKTLRLRLVLRLGPPVLVLAAIILSWYLLVSGFGIQGYIFPTPLAVWNALLQHGWAYLPDAWVTTQEVLAGFGLALVIGLPLAAVMSRSRSFRRGVYPVLIGSQMVPIFAVAALITISLNADGLLPQIVIAALLCFFPIVVNGVDAFGAADAEMVNLLRSAGASNWRIFRTVRFPSALPALFSGSKLAITFAVGGAALGEWFGGQSGLGYLMRFQDDALTVPDMIATAVVLTALGAILFAAVSLVEHFAIPWHRGAAEGMGDLWRSG